MARLPQVANASRRVLTTAAQTAARTTRFLQRRSKLTGAARPCVPGTPAAPACGSSLVGLGQGSPGYAFT